MMYQRHILKHNKVSMNISFHHYAFVGLFVFVLLTNDVNCHCRDKYIYHKCYKVGCGLEQLPTEIPADVTILYISHNNISQITVGAFSTLTNCNELWLTNNKLTYISVGMFSGLTSLKKLVLQNNSIVNIEKEAFSHLPQLTELWLHGNNLTQIRRRFKVFRKVNPE